MSNLEFDNENEQKASLLYGRFEKGTKPPGLVNFLIRYGLVRTEKQAQTLLLSLFFILIILAIVLFVYSRSLNSSLETLPLQ